MQTPVLKISRPREQTQPLARTSNCLSKEELKLKFSIDVVALLLPNVRRRKAMATYRDPVRCFAPGSSQRLLEIRADAIHLLSISFHPQT
jgi:hypothetical protein